jgi:hypothetical protein
VEYRPAAVCNLNKFSPRAFFAIVNAKRESYKPDVSSAWSVNSQPLTDPHFLRHRDQDEVLVGNIEQVQSIDAKLPVFIQLYNVDNRRDNGVGRSESFEFMPIDGSPKSCLVLPEREVGVF